MPEGVEEASQTFLQEAHVLPKLLSNTADVIGGEPIAVWSGCCFDGLTVSMLGFLTHIGLSGAFAIACILKLPTLVLSK
jgi:hypothetical protein